MIKQWNPRFGFYMPIKSNRHVKPINKVTRNDYSRHIGPVPLIELWSDDDNLIQSDKVDLILEFGIRATDVRNPRFGDMVAMVDYQNFSLYKHYIYHKGFTSNTDKYIYSIESSRRDPKKYICPGNATHLFVRDIILEGKEKNEK